MFRRIAMVFMLKAFLAAAIFAQGAALFQQEEEVHLAVAQPGDPAQSVALSAAPKQAQATAVRISGWVRTEGVAGVRDSDFIVVTNLTYERTPVFWYTVLFPSTGTHPWQYVEKTVEARLPVQKVDVRFKLGHVGEAWFRDFKVEEVPAWKENAEVVVATLGDSTGVMAYLPDEQTVWYRLEELLRDRFKDRRIRVRCLAESGEYLQLLLASGRLERELATLERCDFMLIRYGLNDNGKRIAPEEFRKQLIETMDRVKARFPAAQCVLATTIPPFAAKYDRVTRELAKERGLPLIDIAAFLEQEARRGNGNWHRGPGKQVGYRTETHPPDNPTGLGGDKHPNAYGGQLIAEEEFRILAPMVEKRFEAATGAP